MRSTVRCMAILLMSQAPDCARTGDPCMRHAPATTVRVRVSDELCVAIDELAEEGPGSLEPFAERAIAGRQWVAGFGDGEVLGGRLLLDPELEQLARCSGLRQIVGVGHAV